LIDDPIYFNKRQPEYTGTSSSLRDFMMEQYGDYGQDYYDDFIAQNTKQ